MEAHVLQEDHAPRSGSRARRLDISADAVLEEGDGLGEELLELLGDLRVEGLGLRIESSGLRVEG